MAEIGKEAAINAFVERVRNKPEKIDNSRLYAGAPMYYYCHDCGSLAEVLSETHMSVPKRMCDPCKFLTDNGWMAEAKVKK